MGWQAQAAPEKIILQEKKKNLTSKQHYLLVSQWCCPSWPSLRSLLELLQVQGRTVSVRGLAGIYRVLASTRTSPWWWQWCLSPSVTAQLRGKSNLQLSNSVPPVARISRGVAMLPPSLPRALLCEMDAQSQSRRCCLSSLLRVPVSACRLGETEESWEHPDQQQACWGLFPPSLSLLSFQVPFSC